MGKIDTKSNLLDYKESRDKLQINKQKILEFLCTEKYSKSSILKGIVGIKTKAGICKLLRKMEQGNLVKKHRFTHFFLLWGITSNGIHAAVNAHYKVTDWNCFEPSKVKILTLDHQLDIQRIHAMCIQKEIGFIPGRMLGSRAAADKVPDGVITINGTRIAIEVERNVKSKRRYDSIIYNYLKAIKAGEYESVIYVMPDEAKCEQVKNAFYSINKITMVINGIKKPLIITPEKHLMFFTFLTLADIPNRLASLK